MKNKTLTFDSQMGWESFPLPSLPNFTASCAFPSNNSRHTTVASWISQESSQTVPQTPSCWISIRPSKWLLPPISLIWVIGGPFVRSLPQALTHVVSVEKDPYISYKVQESIQSSLWIRGWIRFSYCERCKTISRYWQNNQHKQPV